MEILIILTALVFAVMLSNREK